MKLDTARKILKISGVLSIIGAVIALIFALFLGGGAILGAEAPEAATDTDLQKGILIFGGLAVVTVVMAAVGLLEGIFSLLASKDNKYGMPAFVFAILSLISSIGNVITTMQQPTENSTLIGTVLAAAISVAVLVAANSVRQAYKSQQGTL